MAASIAWASPVPSSKPAAFPAWWFERDVIKRSNPSNATPVWPGDYPASDDFAVVNQGQLKHLAVQAFAELQTRLPGSIWSTPSGATLSSLVTGLGSSSGDNYAAANQGQLKNLAKKFYDVLNEAGYTNAYPWTEATSDDDNYAVANIGQVKSLFAFDLSVPEGQLPSWWVTHYFPEQNSGVTPGADSDGDGLTNLQEFQAGGNPNDYFNQGGATISPKIFVFSGGGVAVPPGEYSTEPVVYKVVNATTGAALNNAPVTIAVTEGTGLVSLTSGGPAQSSFVIRTDSEGLVRAYFKAP